MKMDSHYTQKDLFSARLITALLSLLLSTTLYITDDVLNADGILYIYSVEALKEGGLAAFSNIYNWPFFSALVYSTSVVAGIDIELAAKAVCTVFFILLTDALLLIGSLSARTRLHLVISVVLIISFYTLNNYREFIIRDIGYWAASLYGVFFLLKFLDSQKVIFASLWQFMIIVAFLFRIEAIIFLVAIPFIATFIVKSGERISALAKLSFASFFFLTLCALMIVATGYQEAFQKFSEIVASFDLANILRIFKQDAVIISEQIMHAAADDYGSMVLAGGLLFAVLWAFFSGVSLPLIMLLGWALISGSRWHAPKHQFLFVALIILNLVMLFAFAIKSQLITTRYTVLAIIFLFIVILPTLTHFIEEQLKQPALAKKIIIASIIILGLADTLITTGGKPFLKTVPAWAAHELPPEAKVVTNNPTIEYYFNKSRSGEKITLDKNLNHIEAFDFILVYSKGSDHLWQEKLKNTQLRLLKEQGNRKSKASLYAVDR